MGSYSTTAAQPQAPDGKPRGFLLERGRFTRIDVPGAVQTQAKGINERAQVVGEYLDAAGKFHGFLLSGGRSHRFDAPGGPVTFAQDVNNRGQIVGFSFDGANLTSVRSFLLARGVKGPFTPVTFPGAPLTLAAALNDHGQLVGSYQNPDLASPAPQTSDTPPMQRMS